MEMIAKLLISALLVAALCLVIVVQRNGLIAAKARAERAEQQLAERDAAIRTLTAAAAKNRQSLGKLQADRESIAATLTKRERTIESLQHENATIRHWAESALPDAIAGLRAHAAITGADAYRQRLSAGDAMQSAGDSAQD
jgi:LysB family phage lysis regulatory protein